MATGDCVAAYGQSSGRFMRHICGAGNCQREPCKSFETYCDGADAEAKADEFSQQYRIGDGLRLQAAAEADLSLGSSEEDIQRRLKQGKRALGRGDN